MKTEELAQNPALQRFLAKGEEGEVVFTLDDSAGDDVRATAQRLLDRVALSSIKPSVFPVLKAFAVKVDPRTARQLLAQPEVVSAMPGNPEEDIWIRPVTSGTRRRKA